MIRTVGALVLLWPISLLARTINSVTKNIVTQDNFDGSPASIVYPRQRTVTFTPGTAGRPTEAKDIANSINYVTAAHYAPPGSLAALKNGASINSTYIFNSRLQPCWMYTTTGTALAWQGTLCTATASTATIMDRKYNFNFGVADNGNVITINNNRDSNRTQNFIYDALNRIQQAYTTGPNWGETFGPIATNPGVPPATPGIDAWGNLTNRSGVTGKTSYESLSAAPATSTNQLNGFAYDAAGNTTTGGYTYDPENRLATAGGVTYTYDGDGNRVKKSSGTLYWGMGPLAESDLTGSAASWKEYVFFGSKRVARRDASNSSVHYFFSDHLGSASVVTNSIGTTFEEDLDYYPYGGMASGTSSDHYLFTGKERDSESGLDNFGARFDASNLGRFMTPDEFWKDGHTGDPQSWNEYVYTRNNPLRYIDPTGGILDNFCHADGKGCVFASGRYAGTNQFAQQQAQNNEINTKPPTADPAGTRTDPNLNPPPSSSRTDVVLYGAGSGIPQQEGPETWVMHWFAGACSGTHCFPNNKELVSGIEIDGGRPLSNISDNPKKGEAFDHISREARTINQWWSVGGKRVQVVLGIDGGKLVTTWGVKIVVHGGFDKPPSYSQAPNSPPQ